ncbi:MAG: SelB C-terminal domain-containing protein, partial [Candidatus Binatia bacterium]
SPPSPPDLKQIEKDIGIARTKLTDVIRVMEREKSVVRVATDLYFLSEYVDKVKGLLYKYLSEHNEITAATFRDLLGSSRKYTIPLLEYLDREGITVRTGDTRRLKSATAGKQGVHG